MEKIRIEQLQPGMILGRSIFLADGRILLRHTAEITASTIVKLKELRLPSVYIEKGNDNGMEELVSDATRSDLIQNLYKLTINNATKDLNIQACKHSTYCLMDEVISNQKKPLYFTEIRLQNDYIYSHMVNVCIIAIKIGVKMGYNQLKIAELALGSLFHDLGMMKVPLEIISRIGGLTAEEIRQIQTHSKTGYDILKQIPGFSAVSANVAYQHHERHDGSGYPKGVKGNDIHEFARITAVADVFDAMTTEKTYSAAKSIPNVIVYFKDLKGIEFDPEVVDALEEAVF